MAERFFIGPYKSGLVKDKKPFLIPEDAFELLRNAYVFRDRVRKRFGSRVMNTSVDPSIQQLFTRFRVKLNGAYGNPLFTNGAGNFSGTVPLNGGVPIATPAIGQMFSVDDGTDYEIFTVVSFGAPANLLKTGNATVATFDTTTGALVINGSIANADVYYYPALPVMGLLIRETRSVSDEEVIGFDTRFAYKFNGSAWDRLDTAYFWTGTDSQFFWVTNWRGNLPQEQVFFVTNYNQADGMAYLSPSGTTFTRLAPYYINDTGTPLQFKILSARIILPFQGRLVLLNTIEEVSGGTAIFVNRARWCQNGNPLQEGNPAINNDGGWVEPPRVYGRGDHVDAPTSEAIQTALILKDRLIVYFERSTWELVYTGNQVLPFVWQTINIELGAESTFSIVPFDTVLIGVGDVGIHACNGANVDRIDEVIPDEVFEIQNANQGPERVYGVRDYSTEMVYWAFPYDSSDQATTYPNRVFTYNYRNGAWGYNDDSITAFGQYQLDTSLTWASTYFTWDDSDFAWNSGVNQTLARNVIAGNQQGFVFIIDSGTSPIPINAHAISITDLTDSGGSAIVTAINHNLSSGDYVYIDYVLSNNDPDGTITAVNGKTYPVSVTGVNTFSIPLTTPFAIGASYIGAGTFRRVSQIQIKTKQYNFYLNQGFSFTTNKIDMLVDRTSYGEVSVNVYTNSATIISDTDTLTTYPYDIKYAPMEQWQDMLWHSIYPNSFGTFLQFEITLNDTQMRNPLISDEDFVLNAMFITADQTASRLQ